MMSTAIMWLAVAVMMVGFIVQKIEQRPKPEDPSKKFYEVYIRRQYRDGPIGGDKPYETEAIFVFQKPGVERHPLGGLEVELKEMMR